MSLRRRQCDQNWVGSRSQWPEFGCKDMSVTRIWMQGNVSDQNLAVSRRQYDQNWRLFTAKFWSLTFSHSQILVTDVYSQPNCGHTDVSWATCITRIFALKANLKLEKISAAFFTTFPMLRGVQSFIYQIFSDHGWVPLMEVGKLIRKLKGSRVSPYGISAKLL